MRRPHRVSRSKECIINRSLHPGVTRDSDHSAADRDGPLRRHPSKQIRSCGVGQSKSSRPVAESRDPGTSSSTASESSRRRAVRRSTTVCAATIKTCIRGLCLRTFATGERPFPSSLGFSETSSRFKNSDHAYRISTDSGDGTAGDRRDGSQRSVSMAR